MALALGFFAAIVPCARKDGFGHPHARRIARGRWRFREFNGSDSRAAPMKLIMPHDSSR